MSACVCVYVDYECVEITVWPEVKSACRMRRLIDRHRPLPLIDYLPCSNQGRNCPEEEEDSAQIRERPMFSVAQARELITFSGRLKR
ncbi:hypothetical protein BgiMline_029622 [Biomphalaria glabrata]